MPQHEPQETALRPVFVGIDPGKSGAMAIIGFDEAPLIFTFDESVYASWLEKLKQDRQYCYIGRIFCVLERVGGMPGQSAPASFNFGDSFGFVRGLLSANYIPYQLVRPQTWKKHFGCTKDKNTSIAIAQRLFPYAILRRTERCRKDDDNIAEALLMAEYARRIYNGQAK